MGGLSQSTDQNLAVVTCHYNWSDAINPVRNLHRFIREMAKDRVEVFGIEAHLKGKPARMKGHPNWRTIECSEKCILFQKEQMINLAVQEVVPKKYSLIAWIDADLFFSNPFWVQETILQLQKHKFVQPFDECVWTGKLGGVLQRRASCAKIGLDRNWKSHPGFAWASHRDFFDMVGLYPHCLVGSGDTVFACSVLDQPLMGIKGYGTGVPNLENGVVTDWINKFDLYRGDSKPGFVSGRLYHEYHGGLKERRYFDRAHMLMDLDSTKHTTVNKDGLLEWTDDAPPEMVEKVRNYFVERNEDGEPKA